MLSCNLTSRDFAALLSTASAFVGGIDPRKWPVRRLDGREVNAVYNDRHTNEDIGPSLKGGHFPIPESNWDHIVVPGNTVLEDYLRLIQQIESTASFSSTHFMDADGFMEWHTNKGESPEKPHRLYATYNDAPGSFFRYIPNGSTEVITLEEPVGWYVKVFNVEVELLHCIRSRANRWSIGIRF